MVFLSSHRNIKDGNSNYSTLTLITVQQLYLTMTNLLDVLFKVRFTYYSIAGHHVLYNTDTIVVLVLMFTAMRTANSIHFPG